MKQLNNSPLRWATDASRKTIATVAGASALAMVAGAGVAVASSHTNVIVDADGLTKPVTVWGGTVGGALQEAGVEVGQYDLVTPATSAPVEDGQTITVTSAKPYMVKEDGGTRQIWSTAGSLQEVHEVLADSGRTAALAADRSADREALPSVLPKAGKVTVNVYGKAKAVDAPENATIPQILKIAGVNPAPIDQVFFEYNEDGPVVNVIKQERGTVTEKKEIDFKTVERETDDLYKGDTRVVQEGKKGSIVTTKYQQKRGDEVLVSVQVKQQKTEPVDRIIEKGTKERPAGVEHNAGQASAGGSAPAPQQGAGTGSAPDGVWSALAQCESGGNPGTNSGNGYYGMYQFSLSTWQSVGGQGLPSDASAAEQTKRAQILQQRSGWGQWPACSSALGLH